MATEFSDRSPGARIPQACCTVIGRGEHSRAVGAKHGTVHTIGMAAQFSDRSPGSRIPQACGVVLGRGEHSRAIGVELCTPHPFGMAAQLIDASGASVDKLPLPPSFALRAGGDAGAGFGPVAVVHRHLRQREVRRVRVPLGVVFLVLEQLGLLNGCINR